MLSPQKLIRMMKAKRLSLRALALRIGVGASTISRYCSGKREPRGAVMFRLASALSCKVADLSYKNAPRRPRRKTPQPSTQEKPNGNPTS